MTYKQIAKVVTKFMFKDVTGDIGGKAFQRFVEIIVLPPNTKEYTDELLEIYILETLQRTDVAKQKQTKGIKKVVTELDRRTKKFIAQKQREKFWNKIRQKFTEWYCILKGHNWIIQEHKSKYCERCRKVK